MKSMLEHSKMVFGPLPLELRVRKTRSRTSSRASPYPQPLSSNRSHNRSRSRSASPHHYESHSPILQVLQSIPTNTPGARTRRISVQKVDKAALAAAASVDKPTPVKSIPRQRIPSNARRAALGWSKRNDQADGNANRSFANKENVLSASTTSVFR
jgi:serine/arginine repetitive matrix protein 2